MKAITVDDIDTFNTAQHRAQRRLKLAIHILDNPDTLINEPLAGDGENVEREQLVEALSELLADVGADLVTADTTIQRAWTRK